ncbi:MAG: AMP-binding protein [Clostridia bacterium]|nr:AMP-binding protein [Clostridia bacterium]
MKKIKPQRQHICDLRELVKNSADNRGSNTLFKYKRNGNIQSISYSDFAHQCDCLGSAFYDIGLKDCAIGVIGETCPEWVMTYLAAVNGGNVIVPLDKELNPKELAEFIKLANIKAVVYTQSYDEMFADLFHSLDGISYLIPIVTNESKYSPDDFRALEADKRIEFSLLIERGEKLLSEGYDEFLAHEIDREKMSVILFTSGTTGTSKGVMLSVKNVATAVNNSYDTTEFYDDDVLLSVLPLHHTYEMTCGILTAMLYGATVCINDSLKYVLRNIQLFKPTAMILVPVFVKTMYKKIWDSASKKKSVGKLNFALSLQGVLSKVKIDAKKYLFSEIKNAFGGNLERIICGGAPLSAELVKGFNDFGISLSQGYGITECSPLISVNPYKCEKYGSVGYPVPGLEVRIEDVDENGNGEIVVRGDNVMLGYYNDTEATKAVLSEDRWFKTGDLGYIDQDGYIYITGRKKNVIVLNNGKNVFPEEIEEYLEKIDLVGEVAVVSRDGDDGEVVLTAIIYPNFDRAREIGLEDIVKISEEIKNRVQQNNKTLPTFKQVRNIEIRKTEFEKTTSKKIKRHKI